MGNGLRTCQGRGKGHKKSSLNFKKSDSLTSGYVRASLQGDRGQAGRSSRETMIKVQKILPRKNHELRVRADLRVGQGQPESSWRHRDVSQLCSEMSGGQKLSPDLQRQPGPAWHSP